MLWNREGVPCYLLSAPSVPCRMDVSAVRATGRERGEMKTARSVASAILLTVSLCDGGVCCDICDWPPEVALGEDEARAVLSGLTEMANEAEQGTHAYACPFGGEATTTVTVTSEHLGDSGLYRYGKREIEPSGCRLAVGYPDLAIDGVVEFASRTTTFDSGRRRLKAWVEGGFSWSTPGEIDGSDGFCSTGGLSKMFAKEPGDDSPFTESLDGSFCGASVEIPLEGFPSVE